MPTRPATGRVLAAATGLAALLAAVEVLAGAAARTPAAERGDRVLRLQILLDRVHFSPGEIDGQGGDNTRRAIAAFQARHDLPATGDVDAATWDALGGGEETPVMTPYTITDADLQGPFAEIPDDMLAKSKLPALSYASALEDLAERVHAAPALIRRLNPGHRFATAGEAIRVPSVVRTPLTGAASLVIDAHDLSVAVLDAEAHVLARYPASAGSEHDPLPEGAWKVTLVKRDPEFRYNPDLFWDADPRHTKAWIAPGPNNPVGTAWIGLSKEHYGIHGTPEPSQVGRGQSHGCIRLTNWDALELADLVLPGMPAVLRP